MTVKTWARSIVAIFFGGIAMCVGASPPNSPCVIVGAEKLRGAVSADVICAAIQDAIMQEVPSATYSIKVQALSPSRLNASLIVNGKSLPTQSFAVMDRNLNQHAVLNFAKSLASVVREANQ